MSVEDISPDTLPFSRRLRAMVGPGRHAAQHVFDYVDLAKRMLIELRVKEFSGADVVALATVIEARDRALSSARTIK